VASAARVATDGKTLICLFEKAAAAGEPARWALASYATTDEDWHETAEVSKPMPAGPVALARQGSRFFVATLADGRPQVAPLDVPAAALGDFAPLPRDAAHGEAAPDHGGAMLLVLTALMLLLLVLTWRRAQGRAGAPGAAGAAQAAAGAPGGAAKGLVFAPIWRRAAAAAIDSVVVAMLLFPLMPRMPDDALVRLLTGDQEFASQMMNISLLSNALLIVYSAVAEGVWGCTLGKLLLGIRVRGDTGLRLVWWQAAIRNVLRLVDQLPAFYLLGILLVIVGPRPQRLGDRLARTFVVMKPVNEAKTSSR
jgi:uncharacterized RDD family membrane protein YckC